MENKKDRIIPVNEILWKQIVELVDSGAVVRENPDLWPLQPQEISEEVRRLHVALKEISESPHYMLTQAMEGIVGEVEKDGADKS